MKRKIANRPDWARITSKRYFQQHIAKDGFTGSVCFLLLDQVKAPLTVKYGDKEVCIVDNGYAWIMLFPEGKSYCVTMMIDERNRVLQWYFDIIHSLEFTNEGVPVAVDLYLDLVALPDGTICVLDESELDDALREGVITAGNHAHALDALNVLRCEIEQGRNEAILRADDYVRMLERCKEIG